MKNYFLAILLFSNVLTYAQTWSPLGSGRNGAVNALTMFNADIVAGGAFTDRVSTWNGTSWSPMGFAFDGIVSALAEYNGELYAGGNFDNSGAIPTNRIAKWNGSVWYIVGNGSGITGGNVLTMCVHNNALYVAGNFTNAGGSAAAGIAKWDGTSWSALGTGTIGLVSAMTVYNNELYIGGLFGNVGGVSALNIAKWNGTTWAAVGSGTDNHVRSLAVLNNELYAGGQFANAGGSPANGIAKWNGTTWSAVAGGVTGGSVPVGVFAMSVVNSELYAGGNFLTAGSVSASRIAKWDGTSWSALGTGVNNIVNSLFALPSDVYVGGIFTTPATRIAKVTTCSAAPPTPGPITGSTTICPLATEPYSIVPVAGSSSYTWSLPTGWSGTNTTPDTMYVSPGPGAATAGTITVTAVNNCGTSPAQTLNVSTHPQPAPVVTKTGLVLSTPAGQGSYQWYKSSTLLTGETTNTYTVATNGTYYVFVTNSNNCTGVSNYVTITDVAVTDPKTSELSIYPTRNNGSFNIRMPELTKGAVVRVVNMQGQKVESLITPRGSGNVRVELANIITGVYIIQVALPGRTFHSKIIVSQD